MSLPAAKPRFSLDGRPVDQLPQCCGIYRFFGESGALLYVGKSIDIRSRVREHFRGAGQDSRRRRMMAQVARIDCEPTVGEVSALLLENAAIKQEAPMFNRRQRVTRRLWTIELQQGDNGFLQPMARNFTTTGTRRTDCYGLFHNRHRLESSLRRHAGDQGLCLLMMGLERSRRPCFQHQIKRCDGACIGLETPESHNQRLREAMESERIQAWPYSGPVVLVERATRELEGLPNCAWILIDHWLFLGTYPSLSKAQTANPASREVHFDRDAYRLILKAMTLQDYQICQLDDGSTLSYPYVDIGMSA